MSESIATILKRNVDAYARVINEYQLEVWRIMAVLLCSRDRTEQLVREVFIRAWQRLDEHDPEATIGSFIRRIARERVIEELDRMPGSSQRLNDFRDHVKQRLADPAQADQRQRHMGEAYNHCAGSLPDNIKHLLELRYGRAQDLATVAKQVNRPIASTRQVMRRTRAHLAECMAKRLSSP